MFVNLSNHPSSGWTNAQVVAAHRLGGQIVDVPFPAVDPAGNGSVELAATKVAIKVAAAKAAKYNPHRFQDPNRSEAIIVAIAGEQWLVAAIARQFDSSWVGDRPWCLVFGTSERLSETLPDGKKQVQFEFCQFRPLVWQGLNPAKGGWYLGSASGKEETH